jgi:hypothetical protein
MSAAGDWDPTMRMFVVIIGERYSPAVNVVGPFTNAAAAEWQKTITARVGALGAKWEWRIEEVSDPTTFEA